MIEPMTDLSQALANHAPTHGDVMEHTVSFSPIRWKTGWPHHLRRVPPFRDDATATITRSEVFDFASVVKESEFSREYIIDFLGACFAYMAGKSNQVMQLQSFLRNKGNAAKLLNAVRKLQDGIEPVAAYELLVGTGLPPKFASAIAYFLAGEQVDGEDSKPAIICSNRARVAGLTKDADWSAEEYGQYLDALRAARSGDQALDAVELAAREAALADTDK